MPIITPGPTEISQDVLRAMERSVNPDLDPWFFRLYFGLVERLKGMIGFSGDIYIMSGEGMLGLEAAIANTVAPGDEVLALSNGVFGESFEDLASRYGARVRPVRSEYDRLIDPSLIPRDGRFKAATLVYVETPSGLVNRNIEEISERVRALNSLFIVDAVSAVGGMPVNCDRIGADICLMASQKAFSSTPGLAIVAVSKRAKEEIYKRGYRGYYMGIIEWDEDLKKGYFPYTPSANDFLALDAALEAIYREGLERVYRRHEASREAALRALEAMGIERFVKDRELCAPTVTAFYSPLEPQKIMQFTWEKLGIMLAGSWGRLADRVMRIGHMGYIAQRRFMVEAVAALGAALSHYGKPVDVAAAIRAVNQTFDEYNI